MPQERIARQEGGDEEEQIWVAAGMQQGVLAEFNPNNTDLLCDLGQVTPLSDSHPEPNCI